MISHHLDMVHHWLTLYGQLPIPSAFGGFLRGALHGVGLVPRGRDVAIYLVIQWLFNGIWDNHGDMINGMGFFYVAKTVCHFYHP